MELSASGDREDIGLIGRFDPKREIGFEFAEEPLAELARCGVLGVFSGKRRGIDAECQFQSRFLDLDCVERLGIRGIGQGRPDVGIAESTDCNNVTGNCRFDFTATKTIECRQRSDLLANLCSIGGDVANV